MSNFKKYYFCCNFCFYLQYWREQKYKLLLFEDITLHKIKVLCKKGIGVKLYGLPILVSTITILLNLYVCYKHPYLIHLYYYIIFSSSSKIFLSKFRKFFKSLILHYFADNKLYVCFLKNA